MPTNNFLSCSEQRKIATAAPEGHSWCNFICQKYLPIESFSQKRANGRIIINLCSKCHNSYSLAKKYIKDGKITLEEYKKNPNIIYQKHENPLIEKLMKCVECKEEKTSDKFDINRKVCKSCRLEEAKVRAQKDIDKDIEEIEKFKDDLDKLKFYLSRTSSNKIRVIATHYKITRKNTDKKEDMIVKIILYFDSLKSPFLCLGNCGFKLQKEFSHCESCKKTNAKKTSCEERNFEFKQNLPEFMINLLEIKDEEVYDYNVYCLYAIMECLGINLKKYTKPQMIVLINEALKPKREAATNIQIPNKVGELIFNDITILSREDGFINATQMCKVGGKLFANWFRLDSTKELITTLECEMEIEYSKKENLNIHNHILEMADINSLQSTNFSVIDIKRGGNHSGSWIHPDLAVQLAQWLSPTFAIRVSRWVREIAISGHMSLKTSAELLRLQQENKQIKDTHRRSLQKKQYHKFNQGACFYIISDIDGKSMKIKPGFEGVDIDVRMAQHRSTMPGCKLEYLIYCNDSKLIETNILKRYDSKRWITNHEWLFDIQTSHVIKSVRTILDILNIEYTEEMNLEEYNNEILSDFNFDD